MEILVIFRRDTYAQGGEDILCVHVVEGHKLKLFFKKKKINKKKQKREKYV